MTKRISWIRAAEKDFRKFPIAVQDQMKNALDIAALGKKADFAKPMKRLGSGIFEIALPYQTNAYRAIYALQLNEDIWVLHAFQKKSQTGIKTPKQEINLVKDRLKRLKEMLK
jgi:phage-related protein